MSLGRKEYQIWEVRRRECKGKLGCVLEVRKFTSEKEVWTLFSHPHPLIHLVQKVHNERET